MRTFLVFLLTLLVHYSLFCQDDVNLNQRELILEAESYFYYEEYAEALPIYLRLKKLQPENYNFIYKIGVCYLNIPYEKHLSIAYLEKATEKASIKFKPNNAFETITPLESYFYLGNAYRVNGQYDDALKTYRKFKSLINDKVYNTEIVDQQIAAVEAFYALSKRPVFFDTLNLGDRINTRFADFNAVVTPDENTMVYNQKQQFYDALMFTQKVKGKWSPPINIMSELRVDGDVYATGLSADGSELYLYRSDEFDGNIYISRFKKGRWTPIIKLNELINTKYWESHASVSSDGKTLFFTSNRKGGFGGLDIYKATRVTGDNWENIQNLGNIINTSYNEESPFLTEDGKTLYFSSYGHYNMGGYDVFYSTQLDDKTWAAPLNLGYPLNTPDDDLFFLPVRNGKGGFMSRYYPGGNGRNDIYSFEVYSGQHPRKFKIQLVAGVEGLVSKPESITLKIVNKSNRDTIVLVNLNPNDARSTQILNAGNYQVIFEGKGIVKRFENLLIDPNQKNSDILLTANLQAKEIAEENLQPEPSIELEEPEEIVPIEFQNLFIKHSGSGPVLIPIPLPVGTQLAIVISKDNKLAGNKRVEINQNNFSYSFQSDTGTYTLYFTAKLPDGSVQEGSIIVVKQLETPDKPDLINPLLLSELEKYRDDLEKLANGKLKTELMNLNFQEQNITSRSELVLYLKATASAKGFTEDDINNLLALYSKNQSLLALKLLSSLKKVAPSNLLPFLEQVTDVSSPTMLISVLLTTTAGNIAVRSAILTSLATIADPFSVYNTIESLKSFSDQPLYNYLSTINVADYNINTPVELYQHLFDQVSEGLYTQQDLINAFNLLYQPQQLSMDAYQKSLLSQTNDIDETQKLTLINISNTGVKTTQGFQEWLFAHSNELGINPGILAKWILSMNQESEYKSFKNYFNQKISLQFNNKKQLTDNQDSESIFKFILNNSRQFSQNQEDQAQYISLLVEPAIKQISTLDEITPRKISSPGFILFSNKVLMFSLILSLVLFIAATWIWIKFRKSGNSNRDI